MTDDAPRSPWTPLRRGPFRAVVADRRLLERLATLSEDAGVTHLVDAGTLAAARVRGDHLPAHHSPEPS